MKSFHPDLVLFVLAGSTFVEIARAAGLRVVQEAFADRAYTRDGQLAPRKLPGAVIHDRQKVRERVLKLVKTGIMVSIEGDDISLNADTLCLHGDTPGAWELAKTIREALDGAGIRVVAVGRK